MKRVIILILILISSNIYGNELKKSNLVPELSAFSGLTIVTDYYSYLVRIFSKAYKQSDGIIKIRAVVTPSFSQEYVIGVRQKGDKYFVFKYVSKKQIWYEYQNAVEKKILGSFLKNKFVITETETEISKETFKLTEKAWNQMLHKAKYQKPHGLDGTTYHFSNSSLVTAYAWSPDPKSQTGYLVKITELLGQLTEIKNKEKIEKNISKIAVVLINSLKQNS